MTIRPIGSPKVIMCHPGSKHNYFGWPSIARLQDGSVAVAASGYRLSHICPFGKAVLSVSKDNGNTYTAPTPVIDTVLDDRDTGLTPFGESGLILTSFNNTVAFQRRAAFTSAHQQDERTEALKAYANSYLDLVTPEEEAAVLGSTYRISHDMGVTFGPLMRSPVSSPHGPTVLSDGTILWVGRMFDDVEGVTYIHAYSMTPDGKMERLGEIEDIADENGRFLSCEPHAIELPDGRILCHIRVQRLKPAKVFTIYQSESTDGGRTWTKPVQLLDTCGGAPAHLLLLSSGVLISVYGYRMEPYGIRVMVSHDLGKTWKKDLVLVDGYPSGDLGYPATIELSDGSLLTVYYVRESKTDPAVIMQLNWKLEE